VILRDPVHGLVAFEGDEERLALALLDTREVQRLRRVRQLGLTSLVFPGAEHSRFAHAVGAAHVMSRLQARIAHVMGELPPEQRLDAQRARDAFAAALLHDLGHGPFSHLFEEVVPDARPHEEWTVTVLLDPSTDVHRALAAFDREMPARVADLITGRHELPWLASTISSVLDVDRCDYLLRDSHMTGVRYGIYDLDWLLRALTFGEITTTDGETRTVLAIEGRKGLPPIEGFFLARHFMYQQVYHHKATRAAESLVRAILRRIRTAVREGSRAAASVPTALRRAALGEVPSLGDYLDLDDAVLSTALAACEKDEDAVLADLAKRFRNRVLPKTVPLPVSADETAHPENEASWHEAHARARDVASKAGLDPDLYVWLDVADDVPYHDDAPDTGLWVVLRHHAPQRLGDMSFALEKLRNQRIVRPRLCFAPELRDDVVAAIEPTLARVR
jgi:HD superfamily phosphohydrolase